MTPGRQAFADAAPYLRDFKAALDAGRLVICAQCAGYTFARDPSAIGQCSRHQVESWPFVPFACESFERRQRKTA